MKRAIILLALILGPVSWKSGAAAYQPAVLRAIHLQNEEEDFAARREAMVTRQIARRDIDDPGVLAAMRAVPRHRFVPASELRQAYTDQPLPIGYGQTISQPFIVAYMCQIAHLDSTSRVLEVGTGSGYHASVKPPPSTPSWSPRPPNLSPRPWSGSWPRAAGWSFRWDIPF